MRWRIGVLVLVGLFVATSAVLGGELLRRNLGTEPPTADPALSTDTTSVEIVENMFLGLVDLDEVDMSPVPELATSWTASDDGLTWTFFMRDDVYWVKYDPKAGKVGYARDAYGSPRPVTAYDVEYGVKRTLDPRTASDYAYVLYIIKGGMDLNEADPADPGFQALLDGVGVKALNATTVQFTIEAPAGYFVQIASMWVARPMPQWAIEAHGDLWTEPDNIVTNGPYAMKEWVHNDHMVFVKNPYIPAPLWGGGNIDQVYCTMVVEASTEFSMYQAGELDTGGVPLPEMDRVKADPVLSKELVIRPFPCTYYYGFVTTKPPMDNPDVRKALSMTIDRKTLVEQVTKGGQIPANTFAPGMIFGNAALDPQIAPWAIGAAGWDYDKAVTEAQKLLAKAGYPDGAGLEIILMHNVSEGHARIAQAIQSMWAKAFPKARFIIETQEWGVYLKTIEKTTPIANVPHVYRLGWCQDYPDQNNWVYEVWNSNMSNRARLSINDPNVGAAIAKFDDLTARAGRESDPVVRKDLYFEAERLLVEEIVGLAPIYYYTQIVLNKPWLTRRWHDTPHWDTWLIDGALRGKI
ncbi:MAG: peptide ABC transporter substrate-binding protein [Candidatus Bipolaricaulota bacterium]